MYNSQTKVLKKFCLVTVPKVFYKKWQTIPTVTPGLRFGVITPFKELYNNQISKAVRVVFIIMIYFVLLFNVCLVW